MIINVRHELTSHDLALAVVSFADSWEGPSLEVEARITLLTKTEIRQMAKDRLTTTGDNVEYWGAPSPHLLRCARSHIDDLWPKGA